MVQISHRCADMEKQITSLMGVSKAVLENVIFCHQESSTWPLGKARDVKEIFDEIFAATRYTQALETVRKARLEQQADLKWVHAGSSVCTVWWVCVACWYTV